MRVPKSMPVPDDKYRYIRRLYLEQYAPVLVTNTYLRIALVALTLLSAGLVYLNIRTQQTFQNIKPLVVRINEVGRAEAVQYSTFEYKPQDAEIRYFLIQFVTRHYSRRLATIREDYTTSLYFLDGRLADATIETNRRNKIVETFLAGEGDEIEVKVKNVSIEDLRESPYKATVDFEKIYLTRHDHLEIRRERFVASFVFILKTRVPNSIVPVNPLGLSITYFREDQAFQ